jgi:4-hydroxy-4-methyl-2-oxoglutarate aldolase
MTIDSMYPGELLDAARQLGSATLYEAAALPNSALDSGIRPIWAGASIAGPAYTVECAPGDNLAIHIAMEKIPRGSVLVVATGGFVAGYWGEVLTVAAETAGVIGLVIDGSVRDTAALTARRFPAFSRGISVRGTSKNAAPSVGRPVIIGGTPADVGDLVVADDDGVVVIPARVAAQTVSAGQARAHKEAVMMQQLQEGRSTLELLGLVRWRQR